jgi:hypothetical protein
MGQKVDAVVVLGIVVAAIVPLWACAAVIWGQPGKPLRYAYFAALAVSGLAASVSTFRYEYYANENTRLCGWPIPYVVFQRANADAPWLDFVGPITVLAYPINIVLFMFIPSLLILGLVYRRNWTQK